MAPEVAAEGDATRPVGLHVLQGYTAARRRGLALAPARRPARYEKSRNQRSKIFLTAGVSLPRRQVSAAFLITSTWVG